MNFPVPFSMLAPGRAAFISYVILSRRRFCIACLSPSPPVARDECRTLITRTLFSSVLFSSSFARRSYRKTRRRVRFVRGETDAREPLERPGTSLLLRRRANVEKIELFVLPVCSAENRFESDRRRRAQHVRQWFGGAGGARTVKFGFSGGKGKMRKKYDISGILIAY